MNSVKRKYSKEFDIIGLGRDNSWKSNIAAEQKRLAQAIPEKDRNLLNQCPICEHDHLLELCNIYGYPYVECESCGHIFSAHSPKQSAIKSLYTSEEDELKSIQTEIYANIELFHKRIQMIAEPKVNYVNACLSSKGKWVDVGCGVGEILVAAQNSGWKVMGIEGDPVEVEFARSHGIEIKNTYIDENNRSQLLNDVEVVSFFNVIEHIIDPNTFLKVTISTLKSNSYVVIEVPRHPSLSSLAIMSYPNLAGRHIYPPDHLHIFTEKSLELLLTKYDLQPKFIWLFGQDYYEMITSLAYTSSLNTKSDFFKKLVYNANQIQSAIDISGLSDSMIVISQKK